MYHLKSIGAIAPGYLADLCLVRPINNNWKKGLEISAVYKKGQLITEKTFADTKKSKNPFPGINVALNPITVSDIEIKSKNKTKQKAHVIGIRPKKLLTDKLEKTLPVMNGRLLANLSEDIIKIAVFERHKNSGHHAVGLVKGFHLKSGAIATTINHDSHNVVVIGANDAAIVNAVNLLIKIDGGIVAVDDKGNRVQLPLPIGGLMTDALPSVVIKRLKALKVMIKKMGCPLEEPLLQLSFLSLPVIPSLKITDRGLIDAEKFKKIPVLID
jgi:adenine deaminase